MQITSKRRLTVFTPSWVPCTGEAHSNAYIDNCGICAPRWGEYPTCVTCCDDQGHPLVLRRKPRSRALTVGCERCGKRYDLGTGEASPILWRYIGRDPYGQHQVIDSPPTTADGLVMRAEAGITHVVTDLASTPHCVRPIGELIREMQREA